MYEQTFGMLSFGMLEMVYVQFNFQFISKHTTLKSKQYKYK